MLNYMTSEENYIENQRLRNLFQADMQLDTFGSHTDSLNSLDAEIVMTCIKGARGQVLAPHEEKKDVPFYHRPQVIANITKLTYEDSKHLVQMFKDLELRQKDIKNILNSTPDPMVLLSGLNFINNNIPNLKDIDEEDAMNHRSNCELDKGLNAIERDLMDRLGTAIDTPAGDIKEHHPLGAPASMFTWIDRQTPAYRSLYESIHASKDIDFVMGARKSLFDLQMPWKLKGVLYTLCESRAHKLFEHAATSYAKEVAVAMSTATKIGHAYNMLKGDIRNYVLDTWSPGIWQYIYMVLNNRKKVLAKEFTPELADRDVPKLDF